MPKKRGSTGGGIVPVQCTDKAAEEDMHPPQSHWASQKRCEKVVVCGPAHVGKSSLVKNLLVRSAPWAAVYVCHGCPGTTEYDLVDHCAFTWDEATPDYWKEQSAKHGGGPIAVVTDDFAYADASKTARSNLYAFVQHCCSHLNITSFMVAHSWTQLTPVRYVPLSSLYRFASRRQRRGWLQLLPALVARDPRENQTAPATPRENQTAPTKAAERHDQTQGQRK